MEVRISTLGSMRDFVLTWNHDEVWRLDPYSEEASEIMAGIPVRAFTPWGAGMKLCRQRGVSGIKDCIVIEGAKIYRPFYPSQPSLLSFLDAPFRAWQDRRNMTLRPVRQL